MINLVVALPAEAAPLTQHWRLKKSNRQHPFTFYQNDHMKLVVSGMGKCNSAAATAWLAGITSAHKQPGSIWVNAGIAGNRQLSIGATVCAGRIIDSATQHSWYPTLIKNPLQKATIATVDKPANSYLTDQVYEMEASGFYATAARVSTSELIQCFKVISDNAEHPLTQLTAEKVTALLNNSLPSLEQLLQTLTIVSEEYEHIDSASLETAFHEKWRFSATQKIQLQRLIQRLVAINGTTETAENLLANSAEKSTKASSVLQSLESAIIDSDSR